MAPSRTTIAAIRRTAQKLDGVCAVYGMGSYFHAKHFNDLDLVVVVRPTPSLAQLGRKIRAALEPLGARIGVPLDITIFTESEFIGKPLRDMEMLVPVHVADALGYLMGCSDQAISDER